MSIHACMYSRYVHDDKLLAICSEITMLKNKAVGLRGELKCLKETETLKAGNIAIVGKCWELWIPQWGYRNPQKKKYQVEGLHASQKHKSL